MLIQLAKNAAYLDKTSPVIKKPAQRGFFIIDHFLLNHVSRYTLLMKPIVIVGMMGAGKTTVGRRLARRLGIEFVDTDQLLEERCGASVALIFELEGEAGFRKRESAVVQELCARENLLISTGGGAITVESTRQVISHMATVIYLRAQLNDLWQRTRRDTKRPLLASADPKGRLSELLEKRKHLYEQVAQITIDTGKQPADSIVEELARRLLSNPIT
jgi:shikimate kinase